MNKKGFAPVVLLIILGVLVVAGGAYYFVKKSAFVNTPSGSETPISPAPEVNPPIVKINFSEKGYLLRDPGSDLIAWYLMYSSTGPHPLNADKNSYINPFVNLLISGTDSLCTLDGQKISCALDGYQNITDVTVEGERSGNSVQVKTLAMGKLNFSESGKVTANGPDLLLKSDLKSRYSSMSFFKNVEGSLLQDVTDILRYSDWPPVKLKFNQDSACSFLSKPFVFPCSGFKERLSKATGIFEVKGIQTGNGEILVASITEV